MDYEFEDELFFCLESWKLDINAILKWPTKRRRAMIERKVELNEKTQAEMNEARNRRGR